VIPLREQELLRQRFLRELTSRVRIDYFTQKPSPFIIPGRQECVYCEDVKTLLEEIASLSERIALTVHDFSDAAPLAKELGVEMVPGIVVRGQTNRPIRFFGLPIGSEFPVFIETLVEASRGSVELKPETVKQLRKLRSDVKLQVLVTPTCPYCPSIALTAERLALQSVRVKTSVIELSEFLPLAQRYGVRAVPTTLIDDKVVLPGAMDEATMVQNILRVAEGKPLAADTKPGPGTAFNPAPPPQGQQPPPRRVGSSGLILP